MKTREIKICRLAGERNNMKKAVILIVALIMAAIATTPVFAEMDGSMFVQVDGLFVYNEENQTISAGELAAHDHLAVSDIFVAPHQEAEFSVDFKYEQHTRGGGGLGLFFDAMEPEARSGVADGMGIITWTGPDFSQVKTWNWNFIDVGTDIDYWDPVEEDVAVYGDTETIYNLSVYVNSNSTLEVILTNKTTGASQTLKNGPLDLINEEGFYVGLLTLNLPSVYLDFSYRLGEIAVPVTETSERVTEIAEQTDIQTEESGKPTTDAPTEHHTEKTPETTSADENAGSKTGIIIGAVAAAVIIATVVVTVLLKKKK